MSYVDTFTGDVIEPVEVSYNLFELDGAVTATVETVWPTLSTTAENVLARINDLNCVEAITLQLPPANQVGVGQDIFFNCIGIDSVSITDNDGSVIGNLSPGEVKYFYLTDNSTTAGVWRIFTFGTGTSGADAALLAGRGLTTVLDQLNKLNTSWDPSDLTGSASIDFGARASIFRYTGGVGNITLDSLTSIHANGSGFWFAISNQGTGVITFVPDGTDTINGAASFTLNPGDSCIFATNSGLDDWVTIGLGQNIEFAFSVLVKDISVGGVIDLSNAEAANKIITLVGTPASSTSVNVPAVPSVYWVNNQASGSETVFFGITGLADYQVQVIQGAHAELVCDGTEIANAIDNTGSTGTFLFQFGSLGAPSITFAGDTSFGFYHDNSIEALNFTVDGSFDNVVLSEDGVSVQGGVDASIFGPGYLRLGLRTPPTTARIAIEQNLFDVASTYAIQTNVFIGTAGISSAFIFNSLVEVTTVTVPALIHFNAEAAVLGGGGGVTFEVAFRGLLTAASQHYNIYMEGDAANYFAGNVAVGTLTPDASACLEAFSTTQGFLPPRMTTTQRDAIVGPLGGLIIYNTTTHKLNVRGAVAWEEITSV